MIPDLTNSKILIDLYRKNNSYVWGSNTELKMKNIDWATRPNTTFECAAYFNNSVVMTDCKQKARVLCEEE